MTPEFCTAFAKAQAEMAGAAERRAQHGTFGSYAELSDYIAIIKPAFANHGLFYTQNVTDRFLTGEQHSKYFWVPDSIVCINTKIVHESGGLMESECSAPIPKANSTTNELQARGIVIGYLRRYALAAMCGLASSDGNGEIPGLKPKTGFTDEQEALLKEAAAKGPEPLQVLFNALKKDPQFVQAWGDNPTFVQSLKKTAAEHDNSNT